MDVHPGEGSGRAGKRWFRALNEFTAPYGWYCYRYDSLLDRWAEIRAALNPEDEKMAA
jgi:hypothetical protein